MTLKSQLILELQKELTTLKQKNNRAITVLEVLSKEPDIFVAKVVKRVIINEIERIK